MSDFDPLVLGRRVREARRKAGLTLAELGAKVGRPAPYLSQLENGKVEPKLGLVADLATHLRCSTAELLDAEAPNRRTQLEIDLLRVQRDPAYQRLGLSELRPSGKIPDDVLEHLVALAKALPEDGGTSRRLRAADRAQGVKS